MAVGRWIYQRGGMLCRLPLKRLRVSAPSDFLRAVESSCDGQASWEEVRSGLISRWPAAEVDVCLSTLLAQGALVDAAQVLARQAQIGWTPQPVTASLKDASALYELRQTVDRRLTAPAPAAKKLRPQSTPLMDLLLQRGSARTFDDRALPLQSVVNILWALYGVLRQGDERVHRTVPSGGALYGLRWYIALLRQTDEYPRGLYEVRYHAGEVEGGEISFELRAGDVDGVWNTLLTPAVLSFAHAVIYPVADIPFLGKKYGNRSLTLAQLEAGHAMQNGALAAQLEGAATIVRGDTVEMEVLSLLRLDDSLFPLPSMVLGSKPFPDQELLARQADRSVPVRSVPNHAQQLSLPTRVAVAGPIQFDGQAGAWALWATGRSANPRLAAVKAEAEAWERIGWTSPSPALERARLNELDDAIDPRHLVMYSQAQYRRDGFPYSPFSASRRYPWVKAQRASDGRDVHVMAQCVYALSSLGSTDAQRPFTNASTSGVAAYTDRETARERALVELIERDAFARTWLGRVPPHAIDEAELSGAVQLRLRRLREAGHALSVHFLASAYLPVIAVFAQHVGSAFTSITTAAGFQWEAALDSALSETETRVQQSHGKAPRSSIRAEEVSLANHHGDYFHTKAGFRKADWFTSAPKLQSLRRVEGFAPDGEQLLGRLLGSGLEVLFCDLTPPGASIDQGRTPLHVARAIVPGLVPIWFGYGLEPLGLQDHPQAKLVVAKGFGQASLVHPCT